MNSNAFAAALAKLPPTKKIEEEKNIGKDGKYVSCGVRATPGMLKLLGYRAQKKGWKVNALKGA